ncbi:MAG: hypothetical protein D0531_09740 [Methylococcales bacterium]|nr:MAG: hypothetical protein D0531_09740 [Methylococcales bacterium]
MSFKNRGLGRGLEALLVDVSTNEGKPEEVKVDRPNGTLNDAKRVDDLVEPVELANHQECAAILAEALVLKELIYEIEQQLRDF